MKTLPSMENFYTSKPLWTERLPGGHHWSGRIQKGSVLQFKSLGEQANVSLFCVNSEDKLERFNMPDSLKGQHTAFLSTGHVLYSDLGRCMASIVFDDHGWNDVLCGASRPEQIAQHYGTKTFQDARNEMYQNGWEGLLIEMAKFGLSAKDLTATLNLFSKISPDTAGNLHYQTSDNSQQIIQLRFEMDCYVFLSAAPHGLAQAQTYQPADIELSLYKAKPVGEVDICRDSCEQNQRAFANTARYYANTAN